MKKKLLTAAISTLFYFNSSAQKWTEMMNDTNVNFYDIVKEFDDYWKDKPYERSKGYKVFKRWQWFMEPRVYPSGDMKFASRTYAIEQYNKFLKENPKLPGNVSTNAVTANWTPLGPFGSPVGGDAGRVQVIRVHPHNANILYVGAAAGGFWISNNAGSSYSTTTDHLGSLGVSDIAVDPLNPNNIYISTGDRDAGDTYATGVLKSTDGGYTWNNTGLVWQTSQQRRIHRLLINPINPNTLFIASSFGIYRSYDAGNSWSLVASGNYVDAEYRPGDTTTIYMVTSNGFVRSTNGGVSFSNVSIGNVSANRLAMAVTPANDNYIYIIASAPNNGFGGLYRSTNAGNTFSLMSSTPNIFDWGTTGSGSGGQGWYDIAIDASPTNANEIIAGGVNSWRSTNGGASWTLNTHWTGGGGRPYVHADLHFVLYTSGSTVYLGTDGGVSRTTNGNLTWSTINGNMNIAQIYKMGQSATNPSLIVTGHQDNGSNRMSGSTWQEIYGGDGMDCFINWNTDNTMVVSMQNGGFRRSFNGGGSWANITNGLSGTPSWVSPIVQDPVTPTTYYCGYQQVFKSTDQGSSWTTLGNTGSATKNEIKVSPSNPNIIYATTNGTIWKTTNGGQSWSNVTSGISGGSITDLAMDNQNPNNVYVTLSGYGTNKVYASSNGGATWTNYSTGLPPIPVNCIIFVNNSPQALYVGTDVGVYYREGSMNSWIQYSQGMPNVVVSDFEIHYPTKKLRAATYGRGVWETEMYSDPNAAPYAAFSTVFSPACINIPLQFNDLSANTPTAWSWSFPGGNPPTSGQSSPLVTYSATGIYTVTLVSSNANGSSTPYTSTISVAVNPTFAPVSASVCSGKNVNLSVSTNAAYVNWSNGTQAFNIIVQNTVNSVYTFTASLGACQAVGNASVFIDPVPDTPVIIIAGGGMSSTVAAQSYQWYLNGSVIPGATFSNYFPTQSGYYSLWVANGDCKASSQAVNFDYEGDDTGIGESNSGTLASTLRPNPATGEIFIGLNEPRVTSVLIEIVNSLGQKVRAVEFFDGKSELYLNIADLPSGIYYVSVTSGDSMAMHKLIKLQ